MMLGYDLLRVVRIEEIEIGLGDIRTLAFRDDGIDDRDGGAASTLSEG